MTALPADYVISEKNRNHIVSIKGEEDVPLIVSPTREAAEHFLKGLVNRKCEYHLFWDDTWANILVAVPEVSWKLYASGHPSLAFYKNARPIEVWSGFKHFRTDDALHFGAHLGRLAFGESSSVFAIKAIDLFDKFTVWGVRESQQRQLTAAEAHKKSTREAERAADYEKAILAVKERASKFEIANRTLVAALNKAGTALKAVAKENWDGEWEFVSWDNYGKPYACANNYQINVSGGKFTFDHHGTKTVYGLKTDTGKSSFTWTGGMVAYSGFYRFQDDELTMVFCTGTGYPKAFDEKDAEFRYILKRKSVENPMEGRWKCGSVAFTVAGSKMAYNSGICYFIEVDKTADPMRYMLYSDSQKKDVLYRGIFKIEGERLSMNYSPGGNSHPADFTKGHAKETYARWIDDTD